MGSFLDTFRTLGPMRIMIIAGVLVGLLGFFIFLTTRLTTPQMALLYTDLEQTDSAQIVKQLEAAGVPYKITKNGTEVLVPQDRVLRMRMSMAEQGLPSGGSVGYEIFDKADALGSTNFVQNVNLVRALEGELARTIRSMDSVKAARVHLVLPRRELFSRDKQEPSASIVLNMQGSKRLDREQVLAIQHLVAAAVPSLIPNQISIVDEKGNLLARGFEDGAADLFAQDSEQKRLAYENRLARTIEEILEKTVGFGKVRAEIRADMDFDRVTTNQETYDPDGQVVRSTSSIQEAANSNDSQNETPTTVATNLPDTNLGQGNGASSNSNENRNEETVNYEISKTVKSTVRETGIVRRLSVAVLVDGNYTTDANGEQTYQPRPAQEMEQLATLVRTAIGFEEDRGDTVEVVNMRFVDTLVEEEVQLTLFFGLGKAELMRMAEILVLSIVAILVILLVVRPLVSRAFEAIPSAEEQRALLAEAAGGRALTAPSVTERPPAEDDTFEELIDIDRVEGRVKASSVKKVGEIVEKHPEEAIAIIRNWMYQATAGS
ncbi:MAG: flagellar basal-body MS-ring/collar protein FliF [Rhodospirillales bacterium]|nr:flagellar basal-body MS-ring/collar protein FliF [Rhodospirillales bacterium]